MEGIQVKAVESIEAQSIQEQESKLLEAHEAKFSEPESNEESDIPRIDLRNPVKQNQEEVAEEVVKEQVELGEEQLLSEINSRLGMKINSLEDLKSAREDNGEMDEEMSAFFKYKKETGRGIKDFMKLNEDHSVLANEDLIAAYLRETEMEEGMDDDDLEVMLQDYIYGLY